jgi:hypothetical protein
VKRTTKYETEAALCADFIAWVKATSGQYSQGERVLGLQVFHPTHVWRDDRSFTPTLTLSDTYHRGGWHYWSPLKRHELPEFVPDVIAGDSGPVQLTKWKIAALRIVATLEVTGSVTRDDFKRIGVDPRRWLGPNGWLKPTDKPGVYQRGEGLDFDTQHPTVYAQVLAEIRAKHERILEAQHAV